MKVLLILTLVIFTAYAGRRLGCWRDHSHRAIAGGIRFRGSPARCEAFARKHGWRVYAVQYGGECFTGPNAHRTYSKYGHAHNCRHGRGGGWANSVYEVSGWSRRGRLLRYYKGRYLKWRRYAANQRRRLKGYNRRYIASYKRLHYYAKLNHKYVKYANYYAKRANAYRRSRLYYVKKYRATARACNKVKRRWISLANNRTRYQRKMVAKYRYWKRRAKFYRGRYYKARRSFIIRRKQRKYAYARYYKYVKLQNYHARKYNWWVHHHG